MIKKFIFFASILIVINFFIINETNAATTFFSIDSEEAKVGDTVYVEVRLDTEGKQINVIEGQIKIEQPDFIEVTDLSIAGSSLSLWSRKPSLSDDNRIISFVGGVPGGFNQPDALLLKIYFKVLKSGSVSFTAKEFKSYLNDGKGSLSRQTNRSLRVALVSGTGEQNDELKKVVSSDNMPPEFLAATLGKDQTLFDNKYFVFLDASDYQSGIDHFEVKEGDRSFIRTGNTYVLLDQKLRSEIIVNVYDKAGNIRTLIIKTNVLYKYATPLFIFILVCACSLIFLIFRKFIKIK